MTPALIPWFKLEPWQIPVPLIGHVSVQPFGILAAIAILVGARCAERRARQLGISHTLISDFLMATTLFGLVSAYVLNIVMYEPDVMRNIWSEPGMLVRNWYGLSSFGGFLGGTIAAFVYAHRKQTPLVPLGDAWCYAIPFAWVFARFGCFVVHDHPGSASEFVLAVANYNERGIARHDLGLYEALWALPVAALFFWRSQRPAAAGLYLALVPLLYGPVRFALDFLRATPIDGGDVRYCGLTPGQYFSLLVTGIGFALWQRYRTLARAVPLPL